jgi:hypothetical protein
VTIARSFNFHTERGSEADRAGGPLLLPTIRRHQAESGNRPIEEGAVAPNRRETLRPAWPLLFEHRSTSDYLVLMARDCATTRTWRPRLPVGVRQRGIDYLHCARHPDLSVHRLEPMEEGSRKWVCLQLPTLVALLVGLEHEASVIDTSE